jgi:serine protease AprX
VVLANPRALRRRCGDRLWINAPPVVMMGKPLKAIRCGLLALAMLTSVTTVETQNLTKLDKLLQSRVSLIAGHSNVIVTAVMPDALETVRLLVEQTGGAVGRRLDLIDGLAARVPNTALMLLANSPLVAHLSADRAVGATMERTAATVGAAGAGQDFGLDGSSIGVAIIDSGVASWHDDLADSAFPASQRVERFVDFVGAGEASYDDYGHGTHVAGIIAGNGFDSGGARAGIAPAARLTVLKVLDGSGQGRISDVIAAFQYVVEHKTALNIRLVNVSIGAGVHESFTVDPLTLAAKRTVDAGIIVVAAAGNLGRSVRGDPQYGGITAPGNAPWVVTVGASSHLGTVNRADDRVAAFSSRGPTAIDRSPKPDLVAPGVGIESLSAPGSRLYNSLAPYLLSGTVSTDSLPYLSLSGTSMSAPVVSGTIALMLQANPALTPNVVKAILQYTAQPYPGYDVLTQGAGFLDARAAIHLAKFFATPRTVAYPPNGTWRRRFMWGTGRIGITQIVSNVSSLFPGPLLPPPTGPILCVLGCDADLALWRAWATRCLRPECNPLDPVHETAVSATALGRYTWESGYAGGAVGQTVVWGTNDDGEVVVWGTGDDGEVVVWGTGDDGEVVVWGTGCGSDPSCQPVVWPSQ